MNNFKKIDHRGEYITLEVRSIILDHQYGTLVDVYYSFLKTILLLLKIKTNPTSVLLRFDDCEMWISPDWIINMKYKEVELSEEEVERFWMDKN